MLNHVKEQSWLFGSSSESSLCARRFLASLASVCVGVCVCMFIFFAPHSLLQINHLNLKLHGNKINSFRWQPYIRPQNTPCFYLYDDNLNLYCTQVTYQRSSKQKQKAKVLRQRWRRQRRSDGGASVGGSGNVGYRLENLAGSISLAIPLLHVAATNGKRSKRKTANRHYAFCGQSDDTVRDYASYLVSKTIIMWIT